MFVEIRGFENQSQCALEIIYILIYIEYFLKGSYISLLKLGIFLGYFLTFAKRT